SAEPQVAGHEEGRAAGVNGPPRTFDAHGPATSCHPGRCTRSITSAKAAILPVGRLSPTLPIGRAGKPDRSSDSALGGGAGGGGGVGSPGARPADGRWGGGDAPEPVKKTGSIKGNAEGARGDCGVGRSSGAGAARLKSPGDLGAGCRAPGRGCGLAGGGGDR